MDVLFYAQIGGIQEQKNECVLHTGLHKVCHGVFHFFLCQADIMLERVTIRHDNVVSPAVVQDTRRKHGEEGLAGFTLPAGQFDK